jgi:chemotaxis protein MotB
VAIAARRARRGLDIWPLFVDALANLLIIIIFLLLVFVLAQYYLGQAISGRDEALARLKGQMSELAELLNLERKANADLRLNVAELSDELQASVRRREDLAAEVQALTARAEGAEGKLTGVAKELEDAMKVIAADRATIELRLKDIAALEALRAELEKKLAGTEKGLIEERKLSESARAEAALLNRQVAALREQLRQIEAALGVSEKLAEEQKVQIALLGQRLNAALASKVEELSRYRSEFFGRLREALGSHPGIQIVGDRFVFQSEVLFATGSADLGPEGEAQIAKLATTLRELMPRIPADLNWVLRVDGHTDRVPIRTAKFPSNWELSTARAISVVRFLVEHGIPAERLAATGFGEHQPLDPRDDEIAFRRNRRIELKLTER